MKLKLIIIKNQWNKLIPIGFTFLFTLTTVSCQKYVDIKKNSSQVLLETTEDCQLLLDNYNYMNTNYPSDGEASADDYYLYDSGYKSGSLTQSDQDIYNWISLAIRQGSVPQWETPYKTVFSANLVLETLDGIKSGTADQMLMNNLRGSALFYRAFAFWQIAQLYAKPYTVTTANQDPGIPLRLSSDINDKSERGTVEQTYARITQDLQEAVGLLSSTSSVATRPNKAAAYAMLARTFLSMENYSDALTNASAALELNNKLIDFNTLNASTDVPFNPRFNKEVIFHSIMAASSDNPGANLLNPVNDATGARINQTLCNSYSINDLRKTIFLKANTMSVQVPNGPSSSGTTEVIVQDGTFRFTGNYEPSASAFLFNGLAVDEMYLIRAECYARANNVTSAMSDLNTLLRTRWKSNTYIDMTAANGDDALAKILTERRKELLMRNLRWSDLRRLNHDARFQTTLVRETKDFAPVVTGSYSSSNPANYNITIGYTIKNSVTLPPNDLRYTLLIPQQVINNSSIAQNPR